MKHAADFDHEQKNMLFWENDHLLQLQSPIKNKFWKKNNRATSSSSNESLCVYTPKVERLEPEVMMVSKRNLLFQGLIFRFHVKLQGCNTCSMLLQNQVVTGDSPDFGWAVKPDGPDGRKGFTGKQFLSTMGGSGWGHGRVKEILPRPRGTLRVNENGKGLIWYLEV